MVKNTRCRKATLAIAALLVAGALYPMTALAANKLIVRDAGGTIDKFVVTDTGFIGVGTTTPTAPVNAVGATTQTSQFISQFYGTTTGSGGGGYLAYHNNAAGALPAANDRLGYFLFGAYNGATPFNAAGITARAEQAWTASPVFVPTYFAFETAETNSRTEKMRITGAGDVGIGTTAPTSKLHVVGLPVFANNGAAVAGLLTAGAFYRTGGDPDLVCVVH